MKENTTNSTWLKLLADCSQKPRFVSSPRGQEVKELMAGQYIVKMPAFLDLKERNVNVPFMFAEAAWIISGSNQLEEITPYMKVYANFSDDGVFLRGAYGPKIVDQLGYVVDSIEKDNDTRQAVINIWRERPGPSKDTSCTLSMQFLLRKGVLHMVTTMRSHDAVLGFTYDVFTFSMVANSVRLLLKARGIECELGDLVVTAGSLHLYKKHFDDVKMYSKSTEVDKQISRRVDYIMDAKTYSELISKLKEGAEYAKESTRN